MEGLVYLPYLSEWTPESTLVNLVQTASYVFSAEPPLFAKPKATIPQSVSKASTNVAASLSTSSYSSTKVAATTSPTNVNSSSVSPSYYSHPNQLTTEATLKVKREKLIDEISTKLYNELHIAHSILRDELDVEFANEAYLGNSQLTAQRNMAALQQSLEAMKAAIEEVEQKSVALSDWQQEQVNIPAVEVESRFEPRDDLSAQILRLNAEISAIDDAFYHMERCLVSSQNSSMDLNTFLKETRKLARQQFLAKAHLIKINAICMHQHHQQQLQYQQQPQQVYLQQQMMHQQGAMTQMSSTSRVAII